MTAAMKPMTTAMKPMTTATTAMKPTTSTFAIAGPLVGVLALIIATAVIVIIIVFTLKRQVYQFRILSLSCAFMHYLFAAYAYSHACSL